jgi:hypothetical protein
LRVGFESEEGESQLACNRVPFIWQPTKAHLRVTDYTATKTEATLTRGRLSRNAGDTVSRDDCPSPVFRVCVLHEVDDEAELNIGFMACLAPGPNA